MAKECRGRKIRGKSLIDNSATIYFNTKDDSGGSDKCHKFIKNRGFDQLPVDIFGKQ